MSERRASLVVILLALLTSFFLLSVLSSILTGYPERPQPPKDHQDYSRRDTEEEQAVLMFKVSPTAPRMFWRIFTADYYTGRNWIRTTEEKVVEEFPQSQNADATQIFTVEINTTQREIFLPLPPSNASLTGLSLSPIEEAEFHFDSLGDVYKVTRHDQAATMALSYEVSWYPVDVEDQLVPLENLPEDILDKYLQLPDLPIELWELAEKLQDPSYTILDQILADVQYLRTEFVYDLEQSEYMYERIALGCDVASYLERKEGVCIDAATTLTTILRMQNIPARISIGFNPGGMEAGRLLYYTTGAHSVTEVYLPPYGWIQFDATPPLEENPLVKVTPFKKEAQAGSVVFCQLSITNRRNSTDTFRVFLNSRKNWDTIAIPYELVIEGLHTVDTLFEIDIPSDAALGARDIVAITVVSLSDRELAFSILAIVQVADVSHVATTTSLDRLEEEVIRGDSAWVNGTVLTSAGEQVDNMTVFLVLTKRSKADGVVTGKAYTTQGGFQIDSMVPPHIEIGDYTMIAIALGTTRYAPSTSEHGVRVRATTSMAFGAEKEFLLRYGAIHGHLFWDNGTSLSNAPISFQVTLLTTPVEAWRFQNVTSDDGSFRMETKFENAGTYEVEAVFPGDAYIEGCGATHIAELKFGVPVVQILGPNTAIRGRVFNVTGTVRFEDIGVWGEPLALAIDNQFVTTIETGSNGTYTYGFLVDSEATLGPHSLTVALTRGNISAVQQLVVKSDTTLTATVSNVAGGMFLLFSASLADDHDLPIQGVEIAVANYGLSWTTDTNGNVSFLLDTFKVWPGSVGVAAQFEGSELYIPVTAEKTIVVEPIASLPLFIPLVCPTLVVAVLLYVKHRRTRPQLFSQAIVLEALEEQPHAGMEIAGTPAQDPLRIVFPDIEAALPNVWGVREELRMEVVSDEDALREIRRREVEVSVDAQPIAVARFSSQGRADLSHVFTQKGTHRIQAVAHRASALRSWRAESELRIVDYSEETIRLYNEFLKQLGGHGIHARSEMTAREIQRHILATGEFDPDALHRATACFEKAEYSDHLVARQDYETMYLSLKEMKIDVE